MFFIKIFFFFRVTKNLPFRSHSMSPHECFQSFIHAIFYVGKGKRSRPYNHLYEALEYYTGDKTSKVRQKIKKKKKKAQLRCCNICIDLVPCDRNCAPKCSTSCRCGRPGRASFLCIVSRMSFLWKLTPERPAWWRPSVSGVEFINVKCFKFSIFFVAPFYNANLSLNLHG